MDYNQLIQAYLDNSLDSAGESQLFMALSSSEELRNELKQSIVLDKTMSKRISAFVPTAASTMSVFSQLGIGAAAGAASTIAAVGFRQVILSFLSTYSQAIITGFVAIALTTAGFLTFYNPPDKIEANPLNKISGNYSYSNGPQNYGGGYPYVSSIENNSKTTDTVIKYITKKVIVYEDKKFDNTKTLALDNSVSQNNANNFREIFPSNFKSDDKIDINRKLSEYPINNPNINFPVELSKNINSGISVELKGNGYWSIKKPDVPQYSSSILSNMQLSALYSLSEKFKIGFDLRQESFYQNFYGVNEIGEQYVYKQYPSYISLGLIGRYSFWENEYLRTYAQLGVGGTITGIIGRAVLGFEFMPLSDISFNLGVEGSNLWFLHQSKIFNSPKIGLSYGVSFNF